MDVKQQLLDEVTNFLHTTPKNFIAPEIAQVPEAAGMRIYDDPIIAVASADDALFASYKKHEAVGPHHLLPTEWMPGAKSVVTFFFPFTDEVRSANKRDFLVPTWEWRHARIEGQEFIAAMTEHLLAYMKETLGTDAMAPLLDERFKQGAPSVDDPSVENFFTSNWSERHAAYAAGLGTFGLSKGMITEKGMAGRFASVLTSLEIPPTERAYTELYEYCTMCGACIRHCPGGAIDLQLGKDHPKCLEFQKGHQYWMDNPYEKNKYYYGCGKCQLAVPCETKIPKRPKKAQ